MTSFLPAQSCSSDPLNSPHPIPWNWVMAVMAEKPATTTPSFRYYRSPSLISTDGAYAAYSRIQLQVSADFTQNRVASILLVENLQTGELQTVTPAAPFADNPFVADAVLDQPGTIAILLPIAWSKPGNYLLCREFESIFGSGLASDFAVVWQRDSNRSYTVAPTQVEYSNAVLLGWSQMYPGRVLFKAGQMGEENWPQYAVDLNGQTTCAPEDRPVTEGQNAGDTWMDPQDYFCA